MKTALTHPQILMLHQLGILPEHIRSIVGHPALDKALQPGRMYKTLRLVLPQYGFTPGYPETVLDRATQLFARQQASGVRTLSFLDADYPQALLDIPDFPPLIHYLGDHTLFAQKGQVAVIGARKADRAGCEAAWKLGCKLGREHIVVSGLAAGCDTAAHRGCLDVGGRTVAIVATGLDTVFPCENEGLQADILANGGAILSEQPFGTPPAPKRLVARNRLQAALVDTVIVAQCPEHSGTLHTVEFARRYGKKIKAWRFATPNEVNAGNFNLIGRGIAAPIALN